MNESRERIVPPSRVNEVTVEDVDESLLEIASHNAESSPAVKASMKYPRCDKIGILGKLYARLRFREAKWLTRLILKDFGAVKFPDELRCDANSPPLPQCVQVQATFKSSMPENERRDGPGRVRLGVAARAANNLLPTPPTTAPEPAPSMTT